MKFTNEKPENMYDIQATVNLLMHLRVRQLCPSNADESTTPQSAASVDFHNIFGMIDTRSASIVIRTELDN